MIKQVHIEKAKTIAMTTAKVGAIFASGVLVGTICGVVLFFKISDGDL
jgi:Na+/glutamate symporter